MEKRLSVIPQRGRTLESDWSEGARYFRIIKAQKLRLQRER